uniref:Uncharacterized protein n=1 Tax=Marophrys sp. SRT127 TaxID=2488311 RepID=A0A455REJ1_9EUKA|nr:hypothetical protein [Marophrys sp. SRT127]
MFPSMHNFNSNSYIFNFFYNYELIVMLCFFFFLFSMILLEKGQLGSYLQELSIEAKSKLSRYLEIRSSMIQELSLHLDRAMSEMKRIIVSCDTTSQDILASLQYVTRESSNTDTMFQVDHRLKTLTFHTQFLLLAMQQHFTHDLFGTSSKYNLVSKKTFFVGDKAKLELV